MRRTKSERRVGRIGSWRTAMAAAMLLTPLAAVILSAAPAGAVPACGKDVTANLTLYANMSCGGSAALYVGANNITINLNGHTISGSSTHGIDIGFNSGEAYANVTVENGTISGSTYDVYVSAARNLTLTNLVTSSTSYGVYASDVAQGSFSQIQANNDSDYGFYISKSSNLMVTSSHANNIPGDYGFYDYYGTKNTFTNDTSNNDEYTGFYDYYSNADTFSGDTASYDNQADTSSYAGFYLYCDEYGTVNLNSSTATHDYYYGVYLYYCYNDVTYLLSSYKGSQLENDNVSHNYYYGIYDDYDSFYRGTMDHNTVNSNGYTGIYTEDGLMAQTNNTVSNNGHYGIEDYFPQNSTVGSNTTNGNTETGIYLYDNYGYGNVKEMTDNSASGNGDYGLYADYGAPGVGNIASGNTPYDCFNVVCASGST